MEFEQPRYIVLLGGLEVIPRPVVDILMKGIISDFPSDAWYIDFDNNFITMGGHGLKTLIKDFTDEYLLFTINQLPSGDYPLDKIDFNKNHPLIHTYICCDTGIILANQLTIPNAFIKDGVSVLVARTSAFGIPTPLGDVYKKGITINYMRIGDALFKGIRKAALNDPANVYSAAQFVMYGDPTLHKKY